MSRFEPADADFGAVIVVKPEHVHLAKATCASVRYFMGDTPICVILDGDRPPKDLEAYGVRVICRRKAEQPELRGADFGGQKAKHTVFWLAPYETFLYLDADAVVWGDMRRLCDFERFDFILDEPIGDAARVYGEIMDWRAIEERFPDFDARRHVQHYASSGVYFARRGLLDLDRYLELIRFGAKHLGLFRSDQGVFNFMVFSGADERILRLDQRRLQVITGATTPEKLMRLAPLVDGRPAVVEAPIALHCNWPRPAVRARGEGYTEPTTFFRREFRVGLHGGRRRHVRDELWLRTEDMLSSDFRGSNVRGRFARRRRHLRRHAAQLKVKVRSRTPDWLMTTVLRRPRAGAGQPEETP